MVETLNTGDNTGNSMAPTKGTKSKEITGRVGQSPNNSTYSNKTHWPHNVMAYTNEYNTKENPGKVIYYIYG